jgi:hypothetical protein
MTTVKSIAKALVGAAAAGAGALATAAADEAVTTGEWYAVAAATLVALAAVWRVPNEDADTEEDEGALPA